MGVVWVTPCLLKIRDIATNKVNEAIALHKVQMIKGPVRALDPQVGTAGVTSFITHQHIEWRMGTLGDHRPILGEGIYWEPMNVLLGREGVF